MNEKGLTLIELLTALVIVFIFAGLGANVFVGRQEGIEKSGEVRELVGDLRHARQMAVSEQINYGVIFDFDENYYRVVNFNDDEEVKRKEMITGMELNSVDDYYQVKFTRFGAVFQSGEVLVEAENFSQLIKIKPSGFIDVKRDNTN